MIHLWIIGRRPLRASTGVLEGHLFIIAIEFGERLSYFVISTNLIVYLTKVVHQDLKTAAKNVNYWSGVTTMMPLHGGFLADAYFGRFSMVLISSTIYVLNELLYLPGLILLTMSELIPGLKPCDVVMNGSSTTTMCQHRSPKVHEVVFFIAIYLISIGTGGHKPSLESFGADQFDENHAQERKKKMSYFNWLNFGLCSGLVLGFTVVAHIQQKISWAAGDIIITIRYDCYHRSVLCWEAILPVQNSQAGSPLTPMICFSSSYRFKRNLPYPSNFELPPASTFCLAIWNDTHHMCLTTGILVPWLRRVTGNERGINILPRIGIALVERERLAVAHNSSGKTLTVCFWLAPQLLEMDLLLEHERSLGIALYLTVLGVADFLSSILIKDMNESRIDNFYWLLAGMNGMNLIVYTLLAREVYLQEQHQKQHQQY
ncbi:hypothetical protein MKW92_014736 [Papaver armeniacum]|nr:hypothetical protein MKW92_014736 [Papaver armeniacum]